jgi:hypothetical protein
MILEGSSHGQIGPGIFQEGLRESQARISGVPAEIVTEHPPNTNRDLSLYTSLLGQLSVCAIDTGPDISILQSAQRRIILQECKELSLTISGFL